MTARCGMRWPRSRQARWFTRQVHAWVTVFGAALSACGGQVNETGAATTTHPGTGGKSGHMEAGGGGALMAVAGGSAGMNGAGGIVQVCGSQYFLYDPGPTNMSLMIDQSSAMGEP